MLRDRCRDPWMSELQEESAPDPKEDERLWIDLRDGRAQTKYSLAGPGCLADGVEAGGSRTRPRRSILLRADPAAVVERV